MINIKRRLNIFIDESGDFGFVDGSSELYGVSFTIHESDDFISNDLEYLNNRLKKAKYDGMIHLADLVAKRGDYAHFNLEYFLVYILLFKKSKSENTYSYN